MGEMLVSPLEGHLTPAKAVLADRLQWARSSIRKRLDMGGQQPEAPSNKSSPATTPAPTKSVKQPEEKKGDDPAPLTQPSASNEPLINGHVEDVPSHSPPSPQETLDSAKETTTATATAQSGTTRSPERQAVTSGDPLGALDARVEEAIRPAPVPDVQLTPARSFVVPDPGVRLFANKNRSSSEEEGGDESSEETGSNSSSDDDDDDDDGDSSEESDSDQDSERSNENGPWSASKLSLRLAQTGMAY